jgi:hypothetical protein
MAVDRKYLFVKLPIRPTTVDELLLIRFWLRAITSACYEVVDMCCPLVLNPGFLGLLFPPAVEVNKIKFRCFGKLYLNLSHIPADLGPFICAREVSVQARETVQGQTGQLLDELFGFLCSTTLAVVPASMSIVQQEPGSRVLAKATVIARSRSRVRVR